MTGAAGAVKSTVKETGSLAELVFVAASTAVAVTVCAPSLSVLLHSQLLDTSTVAEHSDALASKTVTTSFDMPVPLKFVSVLFKKALLEGAAITGAGGAVVSMVMVTTVLGSLVLLARSFAVATRV